MVDPQYSVACSSTSSTCRSRQGGVSGSSAGGRARRPPARGPRGGPDDRFPAPGRAGRPGGSSRRPRSSCCSALRSRACSRSWCRRGPCCASSAPARSSPCCGRPRSARRCRSARAACCRLRWACAAGRDQGRHGLVPDLDAGDRGRFDRLSYALMDPVIDVFRPVTALCHGDHGGLATNLFGERRPSRPPASAALAAQRGARRPPERCCEHGGPDHGHDHRDHATWPADAGPGRSAGRADAARDLRLRVPRSPRRDRLTGWCSASCCPECSPPRCRPIVFERYLSDPLDLDAADAGDRHPDVHLRVGVHPDRGRAGHEGLNPGCCAGVSAGRTGDQHRQHHRSSEVPRRAGGDDLPRQRSRCEPARRVLAQLALSGAGRSTRARPSAAATGVRPGAGQGRGRPPAGDAAGVSLRRTPRCRPSGSAARTGGRPVRRSASPRRGSGRRPRRRSCCSTWAAACSASGRARVRSSCALAGSRRPISAPGLHYRLPWPIESHRLVHRDLVRRLELGFRSLRRPRCRRARSRGSL